MQIRSVLQLKETNKVLKSGIIRKYTRICSYINNILLFSLSMQYNNWKLELKYVV